MNATREFLEAQSRNWMKECAEFVLMIDAAIRDNDPQEVAVLQKPSENLVQGAEAIKAFSDIT